MNMASYLRIRCAHEIHSGDICVIEEPYRWTVCSPPEYFFQTMLLGLLADIDLCRDDAALMENSKDYAEKYIEDNPNAEEYSRGGARFWEANGREVGWDYGDEETGFLMRD